MGIDRNTTKVDLRDEGSGAATRQSLRVTQKRVAPGRAEDATGAAQPMSPAEARGLRSTDEAALLRPKAAPGGSVLGIMDDDAARSDGASSR